jgi:hypothetical protein
MNNFETGLWRGLAPALAAEIGALAVIAFGPLAGLIAGVGALLALMLAARAVPAPGTAALRLLVLVAGPPLRFALLLAAAVVVWLPQAQGLLPAVGCLVVLGLVLPAVASGTDAVVARLRPSAA